ncbi:hypothetical protein, partial [Clostridium perfringens]
ALRARIIIVRLYSAPWVRNDDPATSTGIVHAGVSLEIVANNGHNQASVPGFPIMTLFFEDFPPGAFGSFGPRHVT